MKSAYPEHRFNPTQKRATTRARNPITNLLSVIALTTAFTAHAATIIVNGSDDTIHAGNCSLRAAVASMNTATLQGACSNTGGAFGAGDTINFAPSVTAITLADSPSNHLAILVNHLVIAGSVVISRNTGSINPFRIIRHSGVGTLTLSSVTITGGLLVSAGDLGAGVGSGGTVNLLNARVEANITNCAAGCPGGGVAASNVSASNSVVSNNQVRGTGASGGGIFSTGLVEIANSDVSNNLVAAGGCGAGIYVGGDIASQLRVISTYMGGNRSQDTSAMGSGTGGNGGAICVADGSAYVANSELRGNEALGEGGAIWAITTLTVEQSSLNGNFALRGGGAMRLGATLDSHRIENSTFFGNSAGAPQVAAGNGGALLTTNDVGIFNSTFSNNQAVGLGGAIFLNGGTLSMNSTIVANSAAGSPANGSATLDIYRNSGGAAILGGNNLIRQVANVTAPSGTLTGDPLLGVLGSLSCLAPAGSSLGSPGCPRAVSLGVGSPAINAGANPRSLLYDQRGAGFSRVLGAAADIGAIESGGAAVTTWPINVTVSGAAGGGSVSCAPNPVPNGQNAACQPAPNPGYVFVAFSGDCTGATCTLTNVTAARNVTATFAAIAAANAAPVPTLGGAAMGLLALALFGIAHSRRARGSARMRANDGDRP
jgi:Divergent InlB B-repeat domain